MSETRTAEQNTAGNGETTSIPTAPAVPATTTEENKADPVPVGGDPTTTTTTEIPPAAATDATTISPEVVTTLAPAKEEVSTNGHAVGSSDEPKKVGFL